MSSITTKIEGL